ncbi:MAG: 30S ribosomal protein S6 [Coriobacteriales bacterium]|nr:30S ribosomal protein S6 [Coriobacteriales bacterium]
MKAYELLFFVNPTIEESEREATMQRIDSTITAQGGVIDNTDNWGRRKLAYEIDKLADGDYTLIDFHAEPSSIDEINRVLRIIDAVKRSMIIARTDRD